jgi:hypothetical protein
VKVEESFVVRDNKSIDKYAKKNNQLDEEETIKHCKTTCKMDQNDQPPIW